MQRNKPPFFWGPVFLKLSKEMKTLIFGIIAGALGVFIGKRIEEAIDATENDYFIKRYIEDAAGALHGGFLTQDDEGKMFFVPNIDQGAIMYNLGTSRRILRALKSMNEGEPEIKFLMAPRAGEILYLETSGGYPITSSV
jgi:hypothetical protein